MDVIFVEKQAYFDTHLQGENNMKDSNMQKNLEFLGDEFTSNPIIYEPIQEKEVCLNYHAS